MREMVLTKEMEQINEKAIIGVRSGIIGISRLRW